MIDDSLPTIIPYRQFQSGVEGEVDLRGNGVMLGYELRGPSPESSSLADVAQRSRQFAAALLHLGTGDMLHIINHRLPAPEPPERSFPSRAAALAGCRRKHCE
jgi:hypothetical protein